MNDAVNALGRHEVVPPAAAATPHPSVEGDKPSQRSPIWGFRQAPERGVVVESACCPLARRLLAEQQIHLRMDRV